LRKGTGDTVEVVALPAGYALDDCSITTWGVGFDEEKVITCAAAAAPVPTHSVVATAAATVLRGSMSTTIGSPALRGRKVPSKSRDLVVTRAFAKPQVAATLPGEGSVKRRKTGAQRHCS
jgi:hypothetical protein